MERGSSRKLIFLIFQLSLISSASAQMLGTFIREQVGTLPKGRILVSLVNVNASIDRTFNREGDKKTLSNNLNQDVTFSKIASDEKIRGQQLSGLFLSNNLAMSDSAGSLNGNITGQMSGKVPVVGYGLSDHWGLYFSLPIIHFEVQSNYQFQSSQNTQKLLNSLEQSDQKTVAEEFRTALNKSLEHKLYQTQYRWNPDINKTYVGDLQVSAVHVLNLDEWKDYKMAFQVALILPTANQEDNSDLYALRAGDRRLGFGLKYGMERVFQERFSINFSLGGTYLFSSTQAKHLPVNETDELNENYDPAVQLSQGIKFQSQIQFRYQFPKWIGATLGSVWQKKLADKYEGSAFQSSSYQIASDRSSAELLTAYAALDLNSIRSFIEGKFLFPASLELGVGYPLLGQNAISEPVVEIQGTMFF